jgi:excisionase family DNA binding protein
VPITCFAEQELDDLLRDMPDLLDLSYVADFTDVHVRTVRRWIDEGRLAALQRSERSYLVPKSCLRKLLLGIKPEGDDEQASPAR